MPGPMHQGNEASKRPLETQLASPLSCLDCRYCKQKGGLIAWCAKGHWTKTDGSPKHISMEYLQSGKAKLARMAIHCVDYEEA